MSSPNEIESKTFTALQRVKYILVVSQGEVAICNLLVAFDAQRWKNLFENTLTKRILKLVRQLGENLLFF
jgi:hypothetical protein